MTGFRRGDVVLVSFVFANESGSKTRPVLVVSSAVYHRGRREAIVAAITSNLKRRLAGDHVVKNWQEAGLLFPSVVTGILRTIERGMVQKRLGSLSIPDLEAVESELRSSLGL
jgi:mRNA-degrading endonuclease toxin of MazEF toxin-antitoxin module